jgi:GNAT superfamily N-acetyltransferase
VSRPGPGTPPAIAIRAARADDGRAIEAVTLAAYQQYAALMPEHWEAYRQNIVATLAMVHPAAQIVAERDGIIVGVVLLYPAGGAFSTPAGASVALTLPEVRLLAVAPAARGHGVGAALVQECARRARQSGATALALHTTDMMRAAVRLYERLGFRRDSGLDFEPAPGITAKGYRLALALEPAEQRLGQAGRREADDRAHVNIALTPSRRATGAGPTAGGGRRTRPPPT